MSAEEAIKQACLLRFRPIMMTTMAALIGSLPIAIAIVGGLLISQMLTLFITPVIYIYLEKAKDNINLKAKAVEPI